MSLNSKNKILQINIKFSNIKFLKNFCFKDGVKVKRITINSEEEFEQRILGINFFSEENLQTFCLVQQISLDDITKYFIFGVKFNDFYVKVKFLIINY